MTFFNRLERQTSCSSGPSEIRWQDIAYRKSDTNRAIDSTCIQRLGWAMLASVSTGIPYAIALPDPISIPTASTGRFVKKMLAI
jgi:hypothetical protein